MCLGLDYVNRLLGMQFSIEEVKNLLEKMRYGVSCSGDALQVSIPPYRTDVLHSIDLVEDIAIAYGYENFIPVIPKISTFGSRHPVELFSNSVRDEMIGFGFQEVMTLVMTNRDALFAKMEVEDSGVVSTKNSVSSEHSVARNWLMPSLMAILEKNKNQEYPQKIFEVGLCKICF